MNLTTFILLTFVAAVFASPCNNEQNSEVNDSVCSNKKCFYGNDQRLLKTACYVRRSLSHEDAKKFCNDNGMDLLIVENEEVYNELSKFSEGIYSHARTKWTHNAGVWINGKKIYSEWYVYRKNQREILTDGIPFGYEREHPGDCFVLKRNKKEYEGRNYECTKTYHFYCEYK